MEHIFSISPMANIVIPILLLILSFIIYRLKFSNRQVNLPPGSLGWPITGETIAFGKASTGGYIVQFVADRMARYSPKVFKTSIMCEKTAFICDPSGNRLVFSNDKTLVRTWIPNAMLKIFGPDNKIPWGEESLRRRKLMSAFLKPNAVQNYVEHMDSIVRQHMDAEWAPNSDVTAYPLVRRLVFSLARRLFMGMDYMTEYTDTLEPLFEDVTKGCMSIPIDLPGTSFRRAVNAANSIRAQLLSIIRTKQMSEANDSYTFLSHLLSTTDDEGKPWSEPDIANLVFGILFVSQDTLSSLCTNMMYFLADNPHVYDLALKEQLEIKSMKGADKLLTWEDTSRMKYCRNIINEVLRIEPPGIGIFKEVIHDISYEGFTIPKGWKLVCVNSSTHRNPEYFPNPEKFDPTRFEGSQFPFTYAPFGGGSRMCPGYEYARQAALVFMHNLIINFKWEKRVPDEKIIMALVSSPAKGLPVNLVRHT